jgi:hypothetical protein
MKETFDLSKRYPATILRLLTQKGFFDAFEELMPLTRSQLEAYELLEQSREFWFGLRYYSDWESFRNNRYKYLKKCRQR